MNVATKIDDRQAELEVLALFPTGVERVSLAIRVRPSTLKLSRFTPL